MTSREEKRKGRVWDGAFSIGADVKIGGVGVGIGGGIGNGGSNGLAEGGGRGDWRRPSLWG